MLIKSFMNSSVFSRCLLRLVYDIFCIEISNNFRTLWNVNKCKIQCQYRYSMCVVTDIADRQNTLISCLEYVIKRCVAKSIFIPCFTHGND